jgi:hypothetical protein
MKIYRVHIRAKDSRSIEYRYFAAKREAQKYLRTNTRNKWEDDFDVIDAEISRLGLLAALNTYGSHPDNGL